MTDKENTDQLQLELSTTDDFKSVVDYDPLNYDYLDDDSLPRDSVTEEELDKYIEGYMNRHGCSYFEAKLHYGPLSNSNETTASKHEHSENVGVVQSHPGVSVNLGVAALHLLPALEKYSIASSRNGLITSIIDESPAIKGKFGPDSIEGLTRSYDKNMRMGDDETKQAFGSHGELIAAGFSRDEIELEAKKALAEFVKTYVGPDNKKARARLRRILNKRVARESQEGPF